MDDRAVSTVQTVLAETRWLPVPCPTEYLPALARDVLYALEKAGFGVTPPAASRATANDVGVNCPFCSEWFTGPDTTTVLDAYNAHLAQLHSGAECSQCSMPEPSGWCWHQSVSCPFGKPPRSKP